MSSLAHKASALATGTDHKPDVESTVPQSLLLRPSDDGWMLIGTDGEVIFHGLGAEGRRQCLRFARDHRAILLRS
jgi:hypothetical protein